LSLPLKNTLPLQAFLFWENKIPDNIIFRQPVNGQIKTWTWKEAGIEVRKIASAIESYNLSPKSSIAILSKNCAHWVMADLAIMMTGHISVPIYPTLDASTIQQILEHSETKVLFVGKLDKFENQKTGVPSNIKFISFDLYDQHEGDEWTQLLVDHSQMLTMPAHNADDLATIMYTSGTSGKPKGVMLSYGAMGYTSEVAISDLHIPLHAKLFSYLPMSHIAERIGIEIVGFYLGSTFSFAESLDAFAQNLFETQPNLFFAVPRIWAKFQEKILEKLPQKKLDRLLSIPIVKNIIKRSIRKKLGLAKATHLYTGAAPISLGLLLWFDKLGIEIFQAYAMTENSCFGTFNRHGANKFGTVGQALSTIEIRIGDNEEILIKHKALLKGYYKDATLTEDSFIGGYFRTGDQGALDSQGFLTITGRVKDLFKTDRGKYVVPSPIEVMLQECTDIEHACVVGVGIPQPIALVVLSATGKLKSKEILDESLSTLITSVNAELNSYEHVKKLIIMHDDWTIENGLMTPTLKVKRNAVEKIYQSHYERWYNTNDLIISL
jgi:long-chain acyl-CoA synthetase